MRFMQWAALPAAASLMVMGGTIILQRFPVGSAD